MSLDLSLSGGNVGRNGGRIYLWSTHSGTNQKWELTPIEDEPNAQKDFSKLIGKVVTFSSENYPNRSLVAENGLIVLKLPSQTEKNAKANQFKVVSALSGEQGFVSFESVSRPGYFVRHQGFVLKLHPRSNSTLYKVDASFKAVNPLIQSNEAYSFISSNFKDRFIWHQGFKGLLNPSDNSTMFKRDATWIVREVKDETITVSNSVSNAQLNTFFNKYGGRSKFAPQYVEAVTAYIAAEDEVRAGDYTGAKEILDQLWSKYPIGDDTWLRAGAYGTFVGSPVSYNALRMLTDVVNYHLTNPQPNTDAHTINMKVVLVGNSEGTMPRNLTEMAAGTGVTLRNQLDSRLKVDNHKFVHQVLDVFKRYITASTDGKLVVDVKVVELPQATLHMHVVKRHEAKAGHLAGASSGYQAVWDPLSTEVKDETDWWWILYPSFVPGTGTRNNSVASSEAFEGHGFITGGLSRDRKGGLVFICDDLFLLDKQPVLNGGLFTEIEQRCYPPQWFQHEFFHHLYNIFPSFDTELNGLEPTGHDWFTRSFWPADFKGMCEADFYQESLHKRIKKVRTRPLHIRLRTRVEVPPSDILAQLSIQDVLGDYTAERVYNDWNLGKILEENDKYYWRNKAGIQWEVVPALSEGLLKSTSSSDYSGGMDFKIILNTDESTGKFVPNVYGIRHGGGLLIKQ